MTGADSAHLEARACVPSPVHSACPRAHLGGVRVRVVRRVRAPAVLLGRPGQPCRTRILQEVGVRDHLALTPPATVASC